jgi:hypothetical protein
MSKFSKILVFTAILLNNLSANGQAVSKQVLNEAATNFMTENFPGGARKIRSVIPFIYDDLNTLNLFELEPEGWILLSSDLKVEPIIGFSFTGHFTTPVANSNDPMYNWFTMYQRQITQIVTNESFKSQSSWEKSQKTAFKGTTASVINVAPFMKANWNQGKNWNQFCPTDVNGPGGHVYVGCVAVSLAQAMSVFGKPEKGQGYNSYSDPKYGTQYANFGNTSYYWDSISYWKADRYNSLLLYHCAVAVEMSFGADGSGTQTKYTVSALKNYFNFSKNILYKERSGTDKEWQNLLNDQLLHGRPIIYAGDAADGQPGHAFNIDGVNDNGYSIYYHINWGWSGSNNGYYILDKLNPGSFNFSKNQEAVFGIQPYYYPTAVMLSDTVVKVDQPRGTLVGTVNVVDEATDNSYILKINCDSVYTGTKWERDFYLDGDSLKTGRVFTGNDDYTDTISIGLIDQFNNTLNKKVILKVRGGSLTGFSLTEDNHSENFTLFPNPATDRIFISQKVQMDIISVRIYSISGALFQRISDPDINNGIQVRYLSKGFYILEAELANHNLIHKRFIRQ